MQVVRVNKRGKSADIMKESWLEEDKVQWSDRVKTVTNTLTIVTETSG